MDMTGINAALGSLQSCLSVSVLARAMGQTADTVEVLEEMLPEMPLAPRAGSMDILV